MKFSLAILSAVLLVTNNLVFTTAKEIDDLIEAEQEIIAKLNTLQIKSHVDASTAVTTTTTSTKASEESLAMKSHETKRQYHKEEKNLAKAEKLNEEMNLLASVVADADEETSSSNEDVVHHHHNHSMTDAKAGKDATSDSTNVKATKASKAHHSTSASTEEKDEEVEAKIESTSTETSKASKAKAAKANDSIVAYWHESYPSLSHSMSMADSTSWETSSSWESSSHDSKAAKKESETHATASINQSQTTSEYPESHDSKAAKKASETHATASITQSHLLSYSMSMMADESTTWESSSLISKSAKKRVADTIPTKPVVIEYTEKPDIEEEDTSASVEETEEEENDVESRSDEPTESESEESEEEEEEEEASESESEEEEKETSEENEESESAEGSEDTENSDESEQVPRVGSDTTLIHEVQSVMLDGIAMNNHKKKDDTMNSRTDLNEKVMAGIEVSSGSTVVRGAKSFIVGGVCLFVSSIVFTILI